MTGRGEQSRAQRVGQVERLGDEIDRDDPEEHGERQPHEHGAVIRLRSCRATAWIVASSRNGSASSTPILHTTANSVPNPVPSGELVVEFSARPKAASSAAVPPSIQLVIPLSSPLTRWSTLNERMPASSEPPAPSWGATPPVPTAQWRPLPALNRKFNSVGAAPITSAAAADTSTARRPVDVFW